MADIRAFRAYRYDLGRVGALSDVIAPPYDVIDPALQQALYDRSPYNVIRLILNKEEPGDNDHENRYTRAAGFLRDWQADDILVRDSAQSLYVYSQDFEVEGHRHTRRGFLARVRLEPFGSGRIYPHEETLAGPKADRLRLFHATNMNLSPIFGLYPDPDDGVMNRLEAAVGRALPLQATDHLGVVSKLWPVSDQQRRQRRRRALGPKPVFIADGHHRYETGLRYLEDRRAAGDADPAAESILMMLVSMSDPGLLILPTHRIISGFPALDADRLASILGKHFQVEKVGDRRARGPATPGSRSRRTAARTCSASAPPTTASGRRPGSGRRRRWPAWPPTTARRGAAWRWPCCTSWCSTTCCRTTLGGKAECKYVHLLREATDAAAARQGRLVALVPPATMRHVEQIAGNLEKMPPKSTYFYPKLLSGLVFNPLKGS